MIRIKSEYIRDFFLLLIIIYFAQGALYAQGSLISQSSLFAILIISIIYFIKTLFQQNNKNLFYKTIIVFLFLNIFSAIFTADFARPLSIGQLKNIIFVSLSFFPIYYFAQRGIITEKHLMRFFLVMLPIAIMGFYSNQAEIMLFRGNKDVNLVNNVAYVFVYLIPYVFFFKQKKLASSFLMIIILFFIIQGAKRGALIAGVIGAIFFVYYQLKTIEKKNRVKGYFIAIVSVIALCYLFYNFYQSNEFLISRMEMIGEEGGSSGRNTIYANIFNSWLGSDSFFNLLFGFGFASSVVLSRTGNFAHNDWLELLSSLGLLGVIVYGVLFYAAHKYVYNGKIKKDTKILLFVVISIWFFTSIVSMNYAAPNAVFQSILLAYIIGKETNYIN